MSNLLILDGNVTADPELKYTQKGLAFLNFSVVSNYKNGDYKESYFARCVLWNDAEHMAELLKKGTRVLIHGRLRREEWEHNGQKKSIDKVMVSAVAPVPKKTGKQGGHKQGSSPRGPADTGDYDFVPEVDDGDNLE